MSEIPGWVLWVKLFAESAFVLFCLYMLVVSTLWLRRNKR